MVSIAPLIRNNLYDNREFAFGSLWTVSDELVSIPDADRDKSRNIHEARIVLVVSNNRTNVDPLTPVISVVPLSHRTDCIRYGDVLITPDGNGLRVASVARIRLLQPILKIDLIRCIGQINDDACEDILLAIEEFFGLGIDELQ